MPINHKFVSALPNDPDPTVVQTLRDWNDTHTLPTATEVGADAFGAAAAAQAASWPATTAFDATAPVTQAFSDAAATGSAATAAHRDHKHAMMASPLGLPLALTGATAATRYVGGTTVGIPTSGTFAVGDFVIDQTSVVWVCTVAGSPGTWAKVGVDINAQTGVLEAYSRLGQTTGDGPIVSGYLTLTYCTAVSGFTASQIRMKLGGTAAAATPTLIRVGLYTVAANGNLALVASTPNDTTLWANAYYDYSKSFSATYVVVPGQRYAVGFLIVTGGATPTFPGAYTVVDADQPPRLMGTVSGQSDLPSTVTAGSLSVTNAHMYYSVIKP